MVTGTYLKVIIITKTMDFYLLNKYLIIIKK